MELWTPAHARTLPPAVAVMLLLCVVLRLALGKKSLKIRMIPLQVVAVLLLALEIGKQAVSFSRGYDLYHIPLHFCSLFLVALPTTAFYRGRYANRIGAITAALCAAASGITLIYPSLIYGAGDIENFFTEFISFHTVVYHNLVIFAWLLMITLQLHTPEKKGEQKAIIKALVGFCVVAAIASQILQVNYGGFYQCNVPVFEQLRLSMQPVLGYWITQTIYVLALMLVHIVVVLAFYWIYRGLRKLVATKEPAK